MGLTEELKQQYQHYVQGQLNETFIKACQNGNLDIVKYLLTSPDLKKHANIHADEDYGFRIACKNGHLEIVSYLLTSPDLTEHANIHARDDYSFRWACQKGHLEIVKYLLASPELTEHADIHVLNDYGFREACDNGYLDVVSYLLTSSDLVDHADIHVEDDCSFKWACKVRNLEIVTYFLSFNDKRCIDFQHMKYNLDWAINNQYNSVIIAMMKNLKNNKFMEYLECLPKIEEYSQELYEQVKNIELSGDEVNSSEMSLFV